MAINPKGSARILSALIHHFLGAEPFNKGGCLAECLSVAAGDIGKCCRPLVNLMGFSAVPMEQRAGERQEIQMRNAILEMCALVTTAVMLVLMLHT